MSDSFQLGKLVTLIARDRNFLFTLTSYVLVLTIYVNLNVFQSSVFGIIASVLYFLINAVFLGSAIFGKETIFFRLMFGILLLVMLLGFVGWLAVIIYVLDVSRFTVVLLVVATFSSIINRKVKD